MRSCGVVLARSFFAAPRRIAGETIKISLVERSPHPARSRRCRLLSTLPLQATTFTHLLGLAARPEADSLSRSSAREGAWNCGWESLGTNVWQKGGLFVRAACRAWRQGGQRQAAGWQPRRRDADHAVFAQSQGDGQRDDVDGRERTCAQVAGRHVLAIQDTSALRVDEKGVGLSFHPVIAVDANAGTVLGLVDNFFLTRQGGERASRKQRDV